MNNAEQTVGVAEAPSTSAARNGGRRRSVVGWAFLVWFIAALSVAVLFVLDAPLLDRHPWIELLFLDSMLALGSCLLLIRDRIPWTAAGICFSERSISWALNLALLVGIQLSGSATLFALRAPDSFLSSFSVGQRLLWMCVLAPIAEEVFTRGWFQTAYQRAVGSENATAAVLASAAVFAGMHLFVSTSPLRIAVTVVAAFLSGLVYARVRQASGSLLPAVVMHSAFNVSGWLLARPLWLLVSKFRG